MIYFVTFPLIRPNMNGTSDKEGARPKNSPPVVLLLEVGVQGMCPSLKSWKNAIFNLNLSNLVHTFCQHFTENLLFFPIKNICYFHIYSSHLSCFDAFFRTMKIFDSWREKGGVWGDVVSKSWKNVIFILNLQNLVHTFWQHFTKNPFIFMMKYWLIRAIPPTFFFFDALAKTINFWPLKRKMGVWGKIAPSKAKKMQFSNSICAIWWIPSANNLLLIIYWKSIIHFQ